MFLPEITGASLPFRMVLFLSLAVRLLLSPYPLLAAAKQDPYDAYAGKTIRSITIVIRDIFDGPDIERVYSSINGLKVNTREQVVQRELLFKEGDLFDTFRIRESERVLRALRYLRNVEIIPLPDGDFVDLKVQVQDTWTLIPKAAYSSGDGRERKFIGLAESDLLGYGKRVEVGYDESDRRRGVQTVLEDPRLFGSKQRLVAAYLQRNDGERSYFTFDRPFRSFLDKDSWSIDGKNGDFLGRLFKNGDEYFIYREKMFDQDALYTIAESEAPDKEVQRFSAGWSYQEYRFSMATLKDYQDLGLDPRKMSHDPALLPENRRFDGPVFAYEYVEPDYISINYIDRFDRVDDYNLGRDITARIQAAPEAIGSIRDALLFTTNYGSGRRFGDRSFMRGEIGASSRWENSRGLQNSLLRSELRWYKSLEPSYVGDIFAGRHTLASGLNVDYGWELDKERQFLLGADTGLRGYEARAFDGDKKVILNLEDRIHIKEDILRLVSMGAVLFADVGGAGYEPFGSLISDHLYSDVGMGLRFAFPRSSGGQVLRFDIAFPLRKDDALSDEAQVRFLFSAGQVFNSRLASEVMGSEAANVEVGMDK